MNNISTNILGKLIVVAGCFMMALLLQGCYYDVAIEKEIAETESISFSDDIIPIFKSSCVSCHDGVVSYPSLLQDDAYQSLWAGNYIVEGDAASSKVIVKLQNNHPFEGAVTDNEMQKIKLWIEQGAEDN